MFPLFSKVKFPSDRKRRKTRMENSYWRVGNLAGRTPECEYSNHTGDLLEFTRRWNPKEEFPTPNWRCNSQACRGGAIVWTEGDVSYPVVLFVLAPDGTTIAECLWLEVSLVQKRGSSDFVSSLQSRFRSRMRGLLGVKRQFFFFSTFSKPGRCTVSSSKDFI